MNVNVTQKNLDLLPCPMCGCKNSHSDWGTIAEYKGRSTQDYSIWCTGHDCDFDISVHVDNDAIHGASNQIEEIVKQTWNGIAAVMLCKTTA